MATTIEQTAVAPPEIGDQLVEAPLVVGPPKPRSTPIDFVGPVAVVALFIGMWYFMHHWGLRHLFGRPGFLLPPPHEILYDSFVRRIPQPDGSTLTPRGVMLRALWQTTKLTLLGLSLSILIGMTLAIIMAPTRWLERSISPFLVALQAVPILVIAPVLGSMFGYGFGTRLIVTVIISVVPIISNTLFGLRSADRSQHDLFTLKDATRTIRLFKLQLPAALPAIFTGFRISAGLAVIGAVVGELFNRTGEKGIGILMDEYRSRNQFTYTYGALLLSSLLGIAVFIFFGWLARQVTGKWHDANPAA